MIWREVNDAMVIAVIAVIILRVLIVAGYGRGESILLTFYLPTAALLLLAIRAMLATWVVAITPGDWTVAVIWAVIFVTQLAAAAHAWFPRAPVSEMPVHDAKVLARLDALGDQVTASDQRSEERADERAEVLAEERAEERRG